MQTRYMTATCGECAATTDVVEVYWPATRYDPPDGETNPEECSGCGAGWDSGTIYVDAEPPEPDHRDPLDDPRDPLR